MKEQKQRHQQNLYLILDITPGVSHNDILHAYNRAKTTYSSGSLASYTLLDDSSNDSILNEIDAAFAILGNPAKRRVYDIEMGFNTWVEEANPRTQVTPKASVFSEAERIASSGLDDIDDDQPSLRPTLDHAKQATVIPIKVRATPTEAPPSINKAANKTSEARFEANPDFEKQIKEVQVLTGEFLRAVRIYRKYSADALAHRTKLSARHVENIENENTEELHQPVYLRGHLVLICQALELPNPNGLAKSFLDRIQNQLKRS